MATTRIASIALKVVYRLFRDYASMILIELV